MKIIAYETRGDEKPYFDLYKTQLGIEVINTGRKLNTESVFLAHNCDGVSILGHSVVDRQLIDKLADMGIKHIATRTIGTNHIDTDYALTRKIRVSNSSYPPDCVAEFSIMLMLMTLRKYKAAMLRANVNDYSLNGLQGREIRNCTIGVVGTGKTGSAVIRILNGFGAKVLAYSPTGKQKTINSDVEYVDLNEIYKQCDIISLHLPLTKETQHFINKEAIDKMKNDVILINCSRGELIEISALIDGIESRKIGALGLDVFENEAGIYHQDRRLDIIANRNMAYLRQFPNVVMTQHMAFYTQTTTENMVKSNLESFIYATTSDGKTNK